MITVNRLGTFGNNMWEYAVARILAEKVGLKLKCSFDIDDSRGSAGYDDSVLKQYEIDLETLGPCCDVHAPGRATPFCKFTQSAQPEPIPTHPWIKGMPNTATEIDGDIISEPIIDLPINFDMNSVPRARIKMNDYYHYYKYVKNHKEDLKKWFETDVKSPIEVGPNDVVLTIRRGWCNSSPTVSVNNGGCWPVSLCPPGSFFLKLLEKIDYERVILCTDSFDDPYFEFLDELDCEVVKANFSGIEQYALIKSANKIILSASTFCWWAAWLSDATEIYYPWIENLTSWCGSLENPMDQPDGKGGPYIFVKSDLLSDVVSDPENHPDASPQSTAPKKALNL